MIWDTKKNENKIRGNVIKKKKKGKDIKARVVEGIGVTWHILSFCSPLL